MGERDGSRRSGANLSVSCEEMCKVMGIFDDEEGERNVKRVVSTLSPADFFLNYCCGFLDER